MATKVRLWCVTGGHEFEYEPRGAEDLPADYEGVCDSCWKKLRDEIAGEQVDPLRKHRPNGEP